MMLQEEIFVLIVEDENIWAKKIEKDLNSFGFRITANVNCVEDALIAIEKNDFDIALLDVNLHGRNSGIELGKIINNTARKPFIFITASVVNDIIHEATAAKPSAVLTKPVDSASLFVTMQSAIHHFHSKHPNAGLPGNTASRNQDTDHYFFFVKRGAKYKRIDWNDVVCLRSEKNYTSITTTDSQVSFIRSSLQKTLLYIVPEKIKENFVQINRAEVLQISFIDEIIDDEAIVNRQSYNITDIYGKHLKQRLNIIL